MRVSQIMDSDRLQMCGSASVNQSLTVPCEGPSAKNAGTAGASEQFRDVGLHPVGCLIREYHGTIAFLCFWGADNVLSFHHPIGF